MYWDNLTRIKNALAKKHERVKVPYTAFDLSILEALVKYGYLESVARKGRGVKRIIDVKLKYNDNNEPAISGIKFISRRSRRIYTGYKEMKKSRDGHGYFFFSTPEGLMTNIEARKRKVGGELLFEIW